MVKYSIRRTIYLLRRIAPGRRLYCSIRPILNLLCPLPSVLLNPYGPFNRPWLVSTAWSPYPRYLILLLRALFGLGQIQSGSDPLFFSLFPGESRLGKSYV